MPNSNTSAARDTTKTAPNPRLHRSSPPGLFGKLRDHALGLLRSHSVQAALVFGLAGIGFALANLLMARYMAPEDFGLVALLIALVQFGFGLGPAGVELVVNRHRLPVTIRLAARVTFTGTLAALVVCGAAFVLYDIRGLLAAGLFATVVAASLSRVASALFQGGQRFANALFVTQVHNFVLLAAVPIALWAGAMTVEFFLAAILVGYLGTVAYGWIGSRALLVERDPPVGEGVLLKEGLGGLGIGFAVLVMMQAERYAIPLLLSMEAMATFGVLASVVAAPFRMMQIAVGFTLLPRLRQATTRAQASRLIRAESAVGAAICIGGTAAVLLLGPWVIDVIVGDKYDIGLGLFVAAILTGYVKIFQATTVSIVNALGSPKALGVMSAGSWSSLAIAALGATALAPFGLAGVIYGVGLGWLFQALVATLLARRALDARFALATGDGPPPVANAGM